ncbi:MAG: hypothetical protein JWM74_1871 [Myxococcaceae bacterium]|nr:hypothetical protein [Myxococcaceae bacterium]
MPDYELLAAQIMRPRRAKLAAAKSAVKGITDPVDAWAALSNVLPLPLSTNPSRRFERAPFLLPKPGEPPTAPTLGVELTRSPPTIAACLALASDPAGILAAEDLAREAVRRLAPWGVPPLRATIWTVVPKWPLAAVQGGEPVFNAVYMSLQMRPPKRGNVLYLDGAFQTAATILAQHLAIRAAGDLVTLQLCGAFTDAVGFAARWQAAAGLGMLAPKYEHAPGEHVPAAGTPFSELPDPFEPLLELMHLGYWLSGATADALLLVAPAVTA